MLLRRGLESAQTAHFLENALGIQLILQPLQSAIDGLTCKTAVHICYGYGIKANIDWKAGLGAEWRQYERIFPALAASRLDQVSRVILT